MKNKDYHTTINVNDIAQQSFDSITNVAKWWTQNLEGNSQKVNDIFTVHFGQTFITLKVTEIIPAKKIVWYVMDCNKHWLKNKKEWTGTQVIWEITSKNKTSLINFTHIGLIPSLECYNVCEDAWNGYLHNSLMSLINNGKGKPEPKEQKRKVLKK